MSKQFYEIRVEGLLGDSWTCWFEGLNIQHLECDQTRIVGAMDQSMLRGVLTRISDLGLNLISVQQVKFD